MTFAWLKSLMPRGLYGRAALILIVPIVSLQLVVSLVFLQRHFEGVTNQMTRNLLLEITYLLSQVEDAPSLQAAQAVAVQLGGPLDIGIVLPGTGAGQDRRAFYDLSGRAMIRTLRPALPGLVGVDLTTDPRRVALLIDTKFGPMRLDFSRSRVAASNPHQLLVLMLVTGLLMTVVAYLFLRNQLRPIRRLARAATAFGKGEPADYRLAGATEVRQAGAAFLEMRSRIERQMEQRTRMLSGVSHDLRTPLTRLRLGLAMLEETPETKALLRDVADMEHLLNAFLDFARSEATEEKVPTDPVALARKVVEGGRRSGASVEFLAVAENTKVSLRPMAVERALANLVGNAVRYGTRARVSVDVYDKAVRFRVEDDGPGIAPQDREAALKAFARLEPGRNQNRGSGVGLGLTITADTARAHGGTLRLGESATLGGLQADLVIPR